MKPTSRPKPVTGTSATASLRFRGAPPWMDLRAVVEMFPEGDPGRQLIEMDIAGAEREAANLESVEEAASAFELEQEYCALLLAKNGPPRAAAQALMRAIVFNNRRLALEEKGYG